MNISDGFLAKSNLRICSDFKFFSSSDCTKVSTGKYMRVVASVLVFLTLDALYSNPHLVPMFFAIPS